MRGYEIDPNEPDEEYELALTCPRCGFEASHQDITKWPSRPGKSWFKKHSGEVLCGYCGKRYAFAVDELDPETGEPIPG